MPVTNHEQYCRMLDSAQQNHYAYPAVNVTSETTANAALWGFAQKESDGIIQVSTGGGEFASGQGIKDAVLGAISIAEHIHRAAERYDIFVAVHTDHCMPEKLDSFFVPLVEESERRVAAGGAPLFNSQLEATDRQKQQTAQTSPHGGIVREQVGRGRRGVAFLYLFQGKLIMRSPIIKIRDGFHIFD